MSLLTESKEQYATDSGHWYTVDGECAYTQPNKSKPGEMRPTTIKDARKLNLLPSVTTIMKVMSKGDALTNWVKRQVASAAWNIIPGEDEPMEEWVEAVLMIAEKAMTAQRDKGSRDHGIVEEYFRKLEAALASPFDTFLPDTDSRAVEAVLNAFIDLGISGQRIASEKSFACDLGFGGKIDVSGISEGLTIDGMWIVDFKFVDRLEKKKDYIEKVAQGAAYLYGKWGINGLRYGRFANIFVETDTYKYEVREWTFDEIQHGWDVFDAARILWGHINKYRPWESRP